MNITPTAAENGLSRPRLSVRHRFAALAVAVGLLVPLAGSPASAASADARPQTATSSGLTAVDFGTQAWGDCPAGYACLWTGLNATGTMYILARCEPNLAMPSGMNNNIESVRNRGGGTMRLFDNASGTGTPLQSIWNNSKNVNLATSARNRASSLRVDC
ncbi:peptidase inhibitor family I36 protein [Micromonospora sp. NPDC053740]|uniref:peptidase inhibitor family I36 protein n=1 Tax=Micromonospora TaxID=1873 RepID=UPI001EE7C9F2|nr:peptidase inhibitor family I36 protein [Micromonospora alfalfae]MCG5463360.1 peptidase inhibitor family I36 protein [Micromonospora alfalfae]